MATKGNGSGRSTASPPAKSRKGIGGRPEKYEEDMPAKAKKLCLLGATDADLANFFEVGITTLRRWAVKYPEFGLALKAGKREADDRVERSLFQRAVGYDYPKLYVTHYQGRIVTHQYVEHAPPDVTAAIFWLKNRKPNEYRDVRHSRLSGALGLMNIDLSKLSEKELQTLETMLGRIIEGELQDPDEGDPK